MKNASKNGSDNSRRSISRQTTSEKYSQPESLSSTPNTCPMFGAPTSCCQAEPMDQGLGAPGRTAHCSCPGAQHTCVVATLLYLGPKERVNWGALSRGSDCQCCGGVVCISIVELYLTLTRVQDFNPVIKALSETKILPWVGQAYFCFNYTPFLTCAFDFFEHIFALHCQ